MLSQCRIPLCLPLQVLQADGGTRCAAINAAMLALADAGVPCKDTVAAVAAGFLNSTPLLDLNQMEDSGGGPDVAVAWQQNLGRIVLLQMDSKLSVEKFEEVTRLALEGCKSVADFMRRELLQHTQRLATARGALS
jgi:exosome complex component RRP41